MTQEEHARESMLKWLSHPDELGYTPKKIETVGIFEYDGLKYYMFKFKEKYLLSKWYLGISGGFQKNSTEHCGHVFSEMSEYNSKTAFDESAKMIELIKNYWNSKPQNKDTSDDDFQNQGKKYKIPENKLAELIVSDEQCIATGRITVDGCKVGYMFRAEPCDGFNDSGWRFLSGDETEKYLSDISHLGRYSLNTICNYDSDIMSYLYQPVGVTLVRDESGGFVPSDE